MITKRPHRLSNPLALAVVLSLLSCLGAMAQPKFSLVRAAITGSSISGRGVAVDEAGNSWVVGRYNGTADFGGTNITSYSGSWDAFLAKYSPEGNLLWTTRAGGHSYDEGHAVAVDSAGYGIVHGFYNGVAYLDPTNLSAVASHEGFVAKYDPSGSLSWVVRCGGNGPAAWETVAVDAQRNIYVGGNYNGQGNFGTTNISSVGGYNPYVMKLAPSGQMLWVKTFETRGSTFARALAVDAGGNVILAGAFSDTLVIGERCLFSRGNEDVFMIKLNTDGDVLWSRSVGDGNQDTPFAAAFDRESSFFIGGFFYGALNFGVTNLTSIGGQECFLAKYDSDGNVLWARSFQGTSDDSVNSIAVDRSGNVHVAGQTSSSPLNLGSTNLQYMGGYDGFAAKLSPGGDLLWGMRIGGGNNEYAHGVGLDAAGNVRLTGQFAFNFNIGDTNLYAPTGEAMFLAQYMRDLPVIVTQPVSALVMEAASLALSVTVTGTAPFRYQWMKNGAPLAGATNIAFTISGLTTNDSAAYAVDVSNYEGTIRSEPAIVTVLTIGDAADNTDLVWSSGGNIPWINQTNFTIDGVDALRSGAITNSQQSWMETHVVGPAVVRFYWRISSENGYDFLRFAINGVEVTNTSGKVEWKQVSLPVPDGTNILRWTYTKDESESVGQDAGWVDQVTVLYAPKVIVAPMSLVVTAGMTATFTATISGTPPMQFQWYKEQSPGTWIAITGGTSLVLNLTEVIAEPPANYRLSVSNIAGVVTTPAATLTIRALPPITSQPQSQTLNPGGTLILGVGTSIGGPRYQWYLNGVLIPGATQPTFTITNIQSGQAGEYTVAVISSSDGVTLSAPAVVTIAGLALRPTITVAGATGRTYRIEYADILAPTSWLPLTNIILTTSPHHHIDFTAEGQPRRFYRVLAQ